jgi:hypothetical protein
MKNKREIDPRANARAPSEDLNFTKQFVGLWRDLEDNHHWKYDELSPVQLLEKLKLNKHPTDKDELARAEFFLESAATLASGNRLYSLDYCGSWAASLAIRFSGDRIAAPNSIGGGGQRRNRTICALATSV